MTVEPAEIALVRKTFDSALAGASGDIAGVLGELGWHELRAAEPAVAVGELFEAQGRLGGTTSALDIVVASALGVPLPEGTAMVHPGLSGWDGPPGGPVGSRPGTGEMDSDGLLVAGSRLGSGGTEFAGLLVAGAGRATRLLFVVPEAEGALVTISVDAGDADLRPVDGLDPALGLVAVSGRVHGLAEPAAAPGCRWESVALAARRALDHELCGLAQVMLDTAAAHVTERHQFGRPIAAFQTVRHRLTEVFVALAAARAAVDAGWATGDPLLGDAAKALAGRAALLAARHCLQVTGAIGFTEEYGLAARIRRVSMLDALYGTADQLRSRLGTRLLASGAVPRLHPFP